jgi:transposase-like protein
MHGLLPIIRRARKPMASVPVPDTTVQLRAKCAVLEQDNAALRQSHANLAAECEALKAKHPLKLTQ